MKASLFALTTILLPFVTTSPVVKVDVHVTDDAHLSTSPVLNVLDQAPITPLSEQIPGWVFVEGKQFRARIHGNTFWNIKGELEKAFPYEDFLFDPLVFTLNHPEDYTGKFTGTVGKGQISLKWEKSEATIIGRSPIGDFELSGTTRIDYSP